nr:MAG TPA: hypothetical protein [Caudoviricetes sp.]
MLSKLIYIAKSALGLCWKNRIIIILHNGIVQLVAKSPVKVKSRQVKPRQFDRQQVKVPVALVAFVIYQPQGVHLLRCQIIHTDARHFFHAQLLCRQSAAMTDYNHTVPVDHNRLNKAVLLDAFRDIVNLPFIVFLCILPIRRNAI